MCMFDVQKRSKCVFFSEKKKGIRVCLMIRLTSRSKEIACEIEKDQSQNNAKNDIAPLGVPSRSIFGIALETMANSKSEAHEKEQKQNQCKNNSKQCSVGHDRVSLMT